MSQANGRQQQTQSTEPNPAQQQRMSHRATEHATGVQTAADQASQGGPNLSELQSPEFIDTAFNPAVNRGDHVPGVDNNRLEEKYAAEFSRHQGLGYISREEWQLEKWMNRARAKLAKQEFAQPNGLGSRCREGIRRAWTSMGPLAVLDDDNAREISAAFDEKTMMQSLSINARGFRGLTEVTAVTRSEGYDSGGSDNGRGLLNKLTFGVMG